MGTTPNYGIPYAELGDPPHGPNQQEALAEAVDTAINGVDSQVADHETRLDTLEARTEEFGTETVDVPSGGFQSVSVVFVKTFASTPHINISAASGRLSPAAGNITTSGFDLNVDNFTGAGSGPAQVYWQAIEKV